MPDDDPAGAMPAAGGATPPQSPPAQPAPATTPGAATTPPATGDTDVLGEGGKRALEAERTRANEAERARKALETQLADLKLAGASEAEKAIAAARKEGADGVIERVHATVRRSAVREALATAGALPSLITDLAKADEFAALKVNDADEVDPKEIEIAIKAHKARVPDAYKAQPGSVTAGAQPGPAPTDAKDLESAVAGYYAKH